jgi:SagB-type dehydrogenase family enzyme
VTPRARRTRRLWGSWHPVASDFHFATKDTPWASTDASEALDLEQLRQSVTRPAPPPFKHARGAGIPLPVSRRSGEFAEVLLDRRTWRGFGRAPISRTQLGTLLSLTFGARMEGRTRTNARVVFKTSPSAGARHPTEAYVLAVNVRGLPKGLYYFSPETRCLHIIKRGASANLVVEYLSDQWWYRDAAALVLMTSVLPRVRWRYPHPRAYRSVLLDAGHLCQTFCLVATWLKLAPFCTQATADSRIERDLGVDGVDEVLIYAAGVGTRPADGRWVQWPEHEPGYPYVPGRSRRKTR